MPMKLVMLAARSSAMIGASSAARLLAPATRASHPARWTAGVKCLGMISPCLTARGSITNAAPRV
jgi:hypothetical protein